MRNATSAKSANTTALAIKRGLDMLPVLTFNALARTHSSHALDGMMKLRTQASLRMRPGNARFPSFPAVQFSCLVSVVRRFFVVKPTQSRLKELLHYDQETGVFTWLVNRRNRQVAGHVAGCLSKASGYISIGVDLKMYQAHRLAWLYVNGVWPKNEIDHIDGIKSNNKISNLRKATRSLNVQNQKKAHANSSSGFLGAHKYGSKWRAKIGLNGKKIFLGYFATPQEAHSAYITAKRRLHPYGTL